MRFEVASPCSERWADMRPRGAGRHCERCAKTVVDLTRVTRAKAESIAREHGGELCVRLAEDSRGEAVFRAEPRRLPVLAPVALAGWLAACAPPALDAPADDETAQVFDPDEAETGVGLDGSASSFGGSLATGVMMPMAPAPDVPAPVVLAPPPVALDDGTPTPEQVALTRRKEQRRRQVPTQPTRPTIQHRMGVVRCPIDDRP